MKETKHVLALFELTSLPFSVPNASGFQLTFIFPTV